jgi:Fuc2NAc and GlcNAc transferase
LSSDVVPAALAALVLSAVLTRLVLWLAPRYGMLDLPNARSSHTAPTPRGGGIAIVIASSVGLTLLGLLGAVPRAQIVTLLGGGISVAFVGFLDDRHRLPAIVRLLVHSAAAIWALTMVGGLPAIQIGDHLLRSGWDGFVLATLGIVWVLNLFNFMDGIDGIAAAEAIFVLGAGAFLSGIGAAGVPVSNAALVLAAACLGFLIWNWAPARIFMGDVGSGYLGYVIGILAVISAHDDPTAVLSWLILGGVFFVDATVTLIRRLIRRERVYEAHRSHAYQWLARRWHSHSRATIAIMAIDFCWLLPCALFAVRHAALAGWTTAVALLPLALLVVFTGAGGAET